MWPFEHHILRKKKFKLQQNQHGDIFFRVSYINWWKYTQIFVEHQIITETVSILLINQNLVRLNIKLPNIFVWENDIFSSFSSRNGPYIPLIVMLSVIEWKLWKQTTTVCICYYVNTWNIISTSADLWSLNSLINVKWW